MSNNALINVLHLIPHPEGGYYKETYRASESLINKGGNKRNFSTAIYFMLENTDKSRFHRIQTDELWFFHQGEILEIIYIIEGQLHTILLGNNIENGILPQAIIPANTWFASSIKNKKGYSLVSCTVAPGFDFNDFELANREELVAEHPDLKNIIEEFT